MSKLSNAIRLTRAAVVAGAAMLFSMSPATAASVRKEFVIDADPAFVWAALKDFGHVDRRLARGFVVAARLEGDTRMVTFANGSTAHELLVAVDEDQRRLAYAIVGNERLVAHSASAQVFAKGRRKTRFVWISDFLPDELAPYISAQMEQGAAAAKKTIEEDARAAAR